MSIKNKHTILMVLFSVILIFIFSCDFEPKDYLDGSTWWLDGRNGYGSTHITFNSPNYSVYQEYVQPRLVDKGTYSVTEVSEVSCILKSRTKRTYNVEHYGGYLLITAPYSYYGAKWYSNPIGQ